MSAVESLFLTQLQGDGSHWAMTLPVCSSRFLADLEHLFGPRDHSFTLVGFEVDMTPGACPHLWFPDSGISPGDAEGRSRHVVIRLSQHALADSARARWQLAHECVHLLDPWNEKVDGGPTNWLEEGLAAWYQNKSVPEAESHAGDYAKAEELVGPLMTDLPEAVKRIRQECALRIGEIPPDILRNYCPTMCEIVARKLCQRFKN